MIQAIQDLLNKGGRAIIPGVGCLSINDEGKTVFNSFLTFNDGKIIGWLIQNEGLDEKSALNKVQSWAADVKSQVLSGNDFVLGSIGKFILEGKDDIDFSTDLSIQITAPSEIESDVVLSVIEPVVEHPNQVEQKLENVEEIQHNELELTSSENSNHSSVERVDEVPVSKSLDDILNKSTEIEVVAHEISHEQEPTVENRESPSEEISSSIIGNESISTAVEPLENTTPIAEEVADMQQTDNTIAEEPDEIKSETIVEKSEAKVEEVTVNRKRSAFFYVNIVLIVLILGVGVFAMIYTDEVSAWLGISSPKTEVAKDTVIETIQESKTIEEVIIEEQVVEPEGLANEQVAPNTQTEEPKTAQPKPESQSNIPAVASSGSFHIIVGKFAIKENADRLVQKIRDSGYDGKILRSTETGHTVSFHSYPTMVDAKNNINKAKEITGTGAYIEEKK